MGEAARLRMQTWSPRENIEAHVRAIEHSLKADQTYEMVPDQH